MLNIFKINKKRKEIKEMESNLIQKYIEELDTIFNTRQNLNNEYYEKWNKIKSISEQEIEEINKIKYVDEHEEEFGILNEKLLISHYEMSDISNEYNTLNYVIDDKIEKFIIFKNNEKLIEKLKILLENYIQYNDKLKTLNEKLSNILNDHLNIVKEIQNIIKQESE